MKIVQNNKINDTNVVLKHIHDFIDPQYLSNGDMLIGQTRVWNNEMVSFQMKVSSVLKNYRPNTSAILAEVVKSDFQKEGVSAGMSGSPRLLQ